MTRRWISWGYDAARLGGLTCTLTETGGGAATGSVSLTGQYMHYVALGTYTTEDPITGESEEADTGYSNFGRALEDALNAIGNATYTVTFDPDVPGYTIEAYDGSVTAFSLTSISTGLQRMLGINVATLSGALTYDCADYAAGATAPLWHWTDPDIGFGEWTEEEQDIAGEDLIASDGVVRGLVALGTPRRLDFTSPWESAAKIWNASATADDWTWQRALARCRTIEPMWISPDPRMGDDTAVIAMLRADGCTLRPRSASADYLGHQTVPVGAWMLGRTDTLLVDYYAHGWSDSVYYQGGAGNGRSVIGTVRLVGYLIAVPDGSQRIIAGNISSPAQNGWRIQTGLASGAISVIGGGSVTGWAESPRYTFSSGEVGSIFVLHGWVDASGVHMAIGGAEVGTGSSAVTVTSSAEKVTLGRYQHSTGFSNGYIGIISLSATSTAMTAAEVAADAESIMARTSGLVFPWMTGEDMRFVARDIASSSAWHDQVGDNCTLTETGDVTVSRVP